MSPHRVSVQFAITIVAVTTPLSAQARVRGTVYDSLGGHPLAAAMVQLLPSTKPDTPYTVATDSSGRFRIDGVKPGRYAVGFFHDALDAVGVQLPPRTLDVTGETEIPLFIPGATTITHAICGPSTPAADSTGLLIGHVRDAESGESVAGSTVIVTWYEVTVGQGVHRERRQVPVKTDGRGWFALCHVPVDVAAKARAERGTDATGFTDVAVTPLGVTVQEFAIAYEDAPAKAPPDSSARVARRGKAQLSGTVRNKARKVLPGAQLVVLETEAAATVNDAGAFSLRGLPAGTQTVEVRQVGYAAKRVSVDLSAATPRTVDIVMSERVAELEAVTVYGKKDDRGPDATGFFERKKSGFGQFVAREQIEKINAFTICDVLTRTPRLIVTAVGGQGCNVSVVGKQSITRPCFPATYLDGAPLAGGVADAAALIPVEDIAGVEIYVGAAQTPMQFRSMVYGGGCGAIVIWTGYSMRR
ncbi:MAG: carboxypeptidase regulatory-like domain-containing protein [Gemmatimonadota bacterium]|nr:carboxypeptidase regulatory-like domain-containing protein [Gemmatimonadota bacterium]